MGPECKRDPQFTVEWLLQIIMHSDKDSLLCRVASISILRYA